MREITGLEFLLFTPMFEKHGSLAGPYRMIPPNPSTFPSNQTAQSVVRSQERHLSSNRCASDPLCMQIIDIKQVAIKNALLRFLAIIAICNI